MSLSTSRNRLLVTVALLLGALACLAVARRAPDFGLSTRLFDGPEGCDRDTPPRAHHATGGTPWISTVEKGAATTNFSVEFKGWIAVPRALDAELHLEADDGATLHLDGKLLIDNGGNHDIREVVGNAPIGPVPRAVTLCYWQRGGDAFLRLIVKDRADPWRRGMRAIPAHWLFPDGPPPTPEQIQAASDSAQRRQLLHILAFLLVVVAAGAAFRLGRQFIAAVSRLRASPDTALWCAAVFAVALVARLVALRTSMSTCDESIYWLSGREYLEAFLQLDFSSLSYASNKEHPAVTKWWYAVPAYFSDNPDVARVWSAITAAATCALLTWFGRRRLPAGSGELAGFILALMPHMIAHGRTIGHEAVVTLLFSVAVICFVEAMHTPERRAGWWYASSAIATGLSLGARISSVFIFLVFGVLLVTRHWRAIRRGVPLQVNLWMLLFPAIALAIPVLTWPWLWEDTFEHFRRTHDHWFKGLNQELYLGERRVLPWHYLPVYFAATTPPVVLVGMLAWCWAALRRRTVVELTLLLWWLAPMGLALTRAPMDGIRYALPMLVPAALMAGTGLMAIAQRVRWHRNPRVLHLGVTGVTTALLLAGCISVHPYYLDYYGLQVGGPGHVARARWFEIGWWGEPGDTLMSELNRLAPQGASYSLDMHCGADAIPARADLVKESSGKSRFHVYSYPAERHPPSGYRPVSTLTVDGAVLGEVLERDVSAHSTSAQTP